MMFTIVLHLFMVQHKSLFITLFTMMQPMVLLRRLMQHHTSCEEMGCGDWKTGVGCSKLTMSLVNISLKFQTLILQIHCYFLLKKCENPLQRILTFFQQKITV